MFRTVWKFTHSDSVNVYTQFCRETTFVANLRTFLSVKFPGLKLRLCRKWQIWGLFSGGCSAWSPASCAADAAATGRRNTTMATIGWENQLSNPQKSKIIWNWFGPLLRANDEIANLFVSLMSSPIWMIQLSFSNMAPSVQEPPTSEKSPLLSLESDNHFPTLGENENVSTLKYVRCVVV